MAQKVVALLLVLTFMNLSARASLEVDAFSVGSPAALAQLECHGPQPRTRTVSLGGVLATQLDSIPDIVLVAAHGIVNSADQCSVSFRGHRLGISHIEKGPANEIAGDWAVLTLEGRFAEPMQRFGWYVDSAAQWESFALQGGRVSLLKLANGATGRSCDVRMPRGGMVDATDDNTLILSDCVSIPGMSGAPAMVEVNGTPTIMGLNIGTRYDLSNSPESWRSRANLIRLVDTTVEDAIVRAIAREAASAEVAPSVDAPIQQISARN